MAGTRKRQNECSTSKAERRRIIDNESQSPKPEVYLKKRNPTNVVNFLKLNQNGNFISPAITDQIKKWAVLKEVSEFSIVSTAFDQRTTALCWHHANSQQNMIAVGIKNGYISIGKVCRTSKTYNEVTFFNEIGKGYAIYGLQFDPLVEENIFSSCWDGTVTCKNILNKLSTPLLETTCDNQWFPSFDVSNDGEFLVAGCTAGQLHMFDRHGKKLFNSQIHKQRVLSVQLCPRDKNILVTSSLDRMVKIWDLRYIKDKTSYTNVLKHNSPPAIATFSKTGCNQLLTSDQCNEVRVYLAGSWKLLSSVVQPHKQYMHITPIRASWHPTSDLIVIGRYPNESSNEPCSIDFICPSTGQIIYYLSRTGVTENISSINVFNNNGTILASGKGSKLVLWSKYDKL